jgi:hypothetical protein
VSILIIRSIPRYSGAQEQFYNIGNLTWDQRREFRAELEEQGFYVQDVTLSDTLPVQVGKEIRRRWAEEAEKAK